MKAVRVHHFGDIDVLKYEDVDRPTPGPNQILLRVKAAGVGPWDAWVRSGRSALPQPLPLTLGSDVSGIVEAVGIGVQDFMRGDPVYGVTNSRFTGAYAEYAIAEASMLAAKPKSLNHVEAASVPVVASTAQQLVFDHGHVNASKRVLIHGAAGNVGAYAVQFAKLAGATVIASARGADLEHVRSLHPDSIIDLETARFEDAVHEVDVVLDTIGGEILDRSFVVLKRGGIIVSSVTQPSPALALRYGVHGDFFLVNVTNHGLADIARQLDSGQIVPNVGETLSLADAARAHEMLAGAPHKPGKIVLVVA
jgi:NADPH:quinone reductase-like Zn-dependent oxidoreductase